LRTQAKISREKYVVLRAVARIDFWLKKPSLYRMIKTALVMRAILLAGHLSAEPTHFVTSPESKLYLTGDSTLHKFRSVAFGFAAAGELQAQIKSGDVAAMRAALFKGKMVSFILRVPVIKMKSERDGLDENLQKALSAAENPEITFRMTSYEAYSTDEDTRIMVRAEGTLRAAGKERKTMIEGIVNLSGNSFTLSGSTELLMSEFDVKPPVLFMGAVKTDDKVVIHFDLRMIPAKKVEK